jgi:hypothetical protein
MRIQYLKVDNYSSKNHEKIHCVFFYFMENNVVASRVEYVCTMLLFKPSFFVVLDILQAHHVIVH